MIFVCFISRLKPSFTIQFIACQPELYTSPSGDIKSPGYPNHYHNNANCVYNITVENGKRIRIHFSAFDVEDANGHCPYDQLMIFDGDSMDPTGTFCGSGAGTLTSRGNKLFMRFTTNGLVTKRGFFARYQTVDGRKLLVLYHISH